VGFLKQLEKDTQFLAKENCISYRLIIGVHESKHHEGGGEGGYAGFEAKDMGPKDVFEVASTRVESLNREGVRGSEIYFMGITG
jgi:hypothetical protein